MIQQKCLSKTADLPVRAAAPVEYVRICPGDLGNEGFFVIPGTDSCLRIGGRVRAEYRFSDDLDTAGIARVQDDVTFFARGQIELDHRTSIDGNSLRTFIRLQGNSTDGTSSFTLDNAFIQYVFANGSGITAGRVGSFFNFWGGELMSGDNGVYDPTVEMLGATFTFGPGFFASVSVENAKASRDSIFDPLGRIAGFGYGGQQLPNLVGAFGVAQAWGGAQVMAALQQVRHNADVSVDDEVGFAIGAGVDILLPALGARDRLWLQATYADGAINYVDAPTSFSDFSVATHDAYLNAAGTSLSTADGWAVVAAFRHTWTPTITQTIQGAYGEINNPTAGYVMPANTVLASGSPVDYSWYQLGTRIDWTPVSRFTISADVAYTAIETDYAVRNPLTGIADDNSDRWSGRLRIQRDF
ncbi:porin [Salinarimonas ramus]|uniref:Porin n=1 Tax=Salinarimonas ramus TaxID=690164 RepID=A0A917QCK0_9HYPH|nr:porin [Salinarimonas ramus]